MNDTDWQLSSRADRPSYGRGSRGTASSGVQSLEAISAVTESFDRSILDAISAEIAVLDPRGVIIAVNEAWRRFAEANAPESSVSAPRSDVGTDYLAICRAGAADLAPGALAAYEGIRAVLDGKRARFSMEYPCHSPGEERWFAMTVTPLGERPQGAVVAHTDITAYKRAEQEIALLNQSLRRRLSDLQTIFATVPIGLAIAEDPECRAISGNPAAERLLGLPSHGEPSLSATGSTPHRVFQEGRELPAAALPLQRASRGQEVAGQMLEVIRPDGQSVVLHCNAAPLRDETGCPRGAVGAFLDITPLKRAEAALHRSEARFRLLSATAARLLATEDPAGLVTDLCAEVMRYLDCQVFLNYLVDSGTPRLRLHAATGIPPAAIEEIRYLDYGVAVCGAVARDRRRIVEEDILERSDGPTEPLRSYGIRAYCCHPLLVGTRLLGTLSFGTRTRPRFAPDETEVMQIVANQVAIVLQRVEAQAALRASEERCRELVEQAVDGIFVTDRGGRYLDVNRAGAEMLGYSREDLLRLSLADVVAAEELPRVEAELARFEGGKAVISEWTFRRRDGSRFAGEMVGRQLPDGRLQGILRDISRRREVEQALRASQDKNTFLAGLIRDSSQPLAVAYPNGRIGLVNRAFEELTGYTEDELRSLDWSRQLTPPEWRELEREKLAELRRSGRPVRYEKEYRRKDGRRVSIELLVHRAIDPATHSEYFYAFLTDISERKLTEQRHKMEESLRFFVARQTAAAIAHELNQPLTAIASYAEVALTLLNNPKPDPNRLRYALENTVRQAQRAGRVIRELLDLLQQGGSVTQPVDLGKMLADGIAILRANGELGAFDVELSVLPDLPPVQVNRLQIEKVIVNLLRNGLEAMREQGLKSGVIRMAAGRAAGVNHLAEVTVEDNGPGLDAVALERVFQPFYSTKRQGLGMGLAISRSLIEAHGGRLWADAGRGGRFHFTLPFTS